MVHTLRIEEALIDFSEVQSVLEKAKEKQQTPGVGKPGPFHVLTEGAKARDGHWISEREEQIEGEPGTTASKSTGNSALLGGIPPHSKFQPPIFCLCFPSMNPAGSQRAKKPFDAACMDPPSGAENKAERGGADFQGWTVQYIV